MIMTLIMVRQNNCVAYTYVHSNFHHLKIVKSVLDHFRYNFIGDDVGDKNCIDFGELLAKINKHNNSYDATKTLTDWHKYKGLRELDYDGEGYILMKLSSGEIFSSNDIFINVSSQDCRENHEQFKRDFKEFIGKVKVKDVENLK